VIGGSGGDPIRVMSSSPLNTIKTTLGGFPAADLGLGSTSFVQPHNYHFGTATSGSFHSSDDFLSVNMDVSAFAPEDLKVCQITVNFYQFQFPKGFNCRKQCGCGRETCRETGCPREHVSLNFIF
jgi:hypothetical protein